MKLSTHYTATGAIKKLLALRDDKRRQRDQLDVDIRGLDIAIAALNGHATDAAAAALPGKLDAAIAVRAAAHGPHGGRTTGAGAAQRRDLVRAFLTSGPQLSTAVRDHLTAHGFGPYTNSHITTLLRDAGATPDGARGAHTRQWSLRRPGPRAKTKKTKPTFVILAPYAAGDVVDTSALGRGVGILTRAGYLKRTRDGYVRTEKPLAN